jgi:hypothetical protein
MRCIGWESLAHPSSIQSSRDVRRDVSAVARRLFQPDDAAVLDFEPTPARCRQVRAGQQHHPPPRPHQRDSPPAADTVLLCVAAVEVRPALSPDGGGVAAQEYAGVDAMRPHQPQGRHTARLLAGRAAVPRRRVGLVEPRSRNLRTATGEGYFSRSPCNLTWLTTTTQMLKMLDSHLSRLAIVNRVCVRNLMSAAEVAWYSSRTRPAKL